MNRRRTFFQILIELTLLIIGVLAALAVDNWRQSIGEKKMGRDYLINLRDAIEEDTAVIKVEIKRGFDKENAATQVLQLIENGKTVSPEAFEELIENILMLVNPAFMTAVYEELKSTGNLKLIHNDDIKKNMILYYSYLDVIHIQSSKFMTYDPDFMDVIDYEELTYRRPFSQEIILSRLRKSENNRFYLRKLQKDMYRYHQVMIYTTLPKSLELLDKINLELKSE